jgi:hypothetical protein
MNAQNAESLAQAVRMVRDIDAQTPDGRRAALFAQANGISMFDQFVAARRTNHEPINAPAFQTADSLDLVPGDGDLEA